MSQDRLKQIEDQLKDNIEQLKTKRCEKSLAYFTQQAWHIIEPETELLWNWHLDAICGFLEACYRRKILRLIINVPPGSMKSILVSVMFPAWVWAQTPNQSINGVSNIQDLAIRDASKTRRILTDEWFQKQWPLELRSDQAAKTNYENTQAGFRGSLGITGNITGKRSDIMLIDDPHDATNVNSDLQRKSVLKTYDEKLNTRINNPNHSIMVLIMQRLHHMDLTGHLLTKKKRPWAHVCIPMEYEAELTYNTEKLMGVAADYNTCLRHIATEKEMDSSKVTKAMVHAEQEKRRSHNAYLALQFDDPRTKEGELMFPALFNKATVESLHEDMGEFIAAGQLQQRPSVKGGGILKQHWFRVWDDTRPLPECDHIWTSWDTAYSEKDMQNNSYSACTQWGLFWNPDQQRDCLLLLNVWFDQVDYPTLRTKAKELEKELKPDCHLIEKKASGQSLIQDLRQAKVHVKTYSPDKDKVTRAYTVQAMLESGQIYIPDRKWAHHFTHLLSTFPTGVAESNDLTDTFTQACLYVKNRWYVTNSNDDDDWDKPEKFTRRSAYG